MTEPNATTSRLAATEVVANAAVTPAMLTSALSTVGNPAAVNWSNWNGARDHMVSDISSGVSGGVGILVAGNFKPVMTALDATRVFILYYDSAAGGARSVIATVNATTDVVTYGTVYSAATPIGAALNCRVCKIDTDKVVVFYRLSTTSVRSVVFTTAADVIVYGTDVLVNTGTGITYMDVCPVDVGKAACGYQMSATTNFNALSVSGTTITVGTVASQATDAPGIRLAQLAAGSIIALYANDAAGDMRLCAATVSGTTMTFGTPVTAFSAVSTTFSGECALAVLSPTKIAAFLFDTNNKTFTCEASISGTTVTVAGFADLLNNRYPVRFPSAIPVSATAALHAGVVVTATNANLCVTLAALDTPSSPNAPVFTQQTVSNGYAYMSAGVQLTALSANRVLALYLVYGNQTVLMPKLHLIQL